MRKDKGYVKKGVAFAVILLFIITAVSPMVIGFKFDAITDVDSEMETLLDNLAFYCYGVNGFDSAKYEYMKEQLLEDNSNDDIEIVENVVQPVLPILTASSGGPMNSPWPMQCYDLHHTSRSSYSTADNPGDEIWRFETDGWIDGGPVIDGDGTIYFGGNHGGLPWYLFAVYPNGTVKWRYKTGGLIWATPAISEDGTIYIGTYGDYLHAINPDGTRKWRFLAHASITSSPVIAEDGTVYFGVMGPSYDKGRIYAVNPNGTEKWHYDTGYWITSDPAIGDDGTIYIGSEDTYLYAMNPNGTLKWRFKTGDWIKGPPSIADDGTVYIGSYDNYLYAIYPNNGTMKWKLGGMGTETNPSIASDGTIYIGNEDLFAIYPNGTLKWSNNLGPGRHIHKSSPAISADGTIYVGTNIGEVSGGDIIAFNPDGTEKWRKKIANLWVDSSPCIGEDGTVYIGSASEDAGGETYGYLYAFNRGELEADANGPYYGLIDEPVQFNGSASKGYPPYSYEWDFGDGNTSDEQNPTYTYTDAGNYTVTLTVIDDSGNTSDDTTWAWIQETNDPPNKPSVDGETNGNIETKYDYNFLTSDPEGLQVWYYIEWGDDTNTGWIGPYPSGEEITKSHSWSKKDTYIIRCKAKDPYGAESEWGILEVTMPKNQQASNMWFLRWLERFPLLNQMINLLLENEI